MRSHPSTVVWLVRCALLGRDPLVRRLSVDVCRTGPLMLNQ
jgi:hypothetical protein